MTTGVELQIKCSKEALCLVLVYLEAGTLVEATELVC